MTATMTNGNGSKAAAIRDALEGMSRPDIAAKYGMSDGWAGGVITESGRSGRARSAAIDASVASGVLPPRSPAPRAIDITPIANPEPKPLTGTKARIAELEAQVAALEQVDRGWLDWLVIVVVGTAVAISSSGHIIELGLRTSLGWYAYLAPLALDGLTIAAIRAWQVDKHRLVAGIGIAVGLVGAVAANVLWARPEIADPADVRVVLVAFPPIALAVIVHLVRR